jgi:hypothetical protein
MESTSTKFFTLKMPHPALNKPFDVHGMRTYVYRLSDYTTSRALLARGKAGCANLRRAKKLVKYGITLQCAYKCLIFDDFAMQPRHRTQRVKLDDIGVLAKSQVAAAGIFYAVAPMPKQALLCAKSQSSIDGRKTIRGIGSVNA